MGDLPDQRREPVVSLREVTKRYPGVTALDAVSVAFSPGEIHALVGENGAGKSTIVKMLTGATSPDDGDVLVGGVPHPALNPRTSREARIGAVFQETQIAPELSVTENLLLERLPRRRGVVRWRAARRAAAEALDRVGLRVSPDAEAGRLRPVEVKQLEIARALLLDSRVLILDEPTAVLGRTDTARLFGLLQGLRDEGTSIVYISHHLEEVVEIADWVTVMRDGRVVESRGPEGLTTDHLVRSMLGRAQERVATADAAAPRAAAGDVRLDVTDLHCAPGLGGVNLQVRAGEIVCITGLADSGRRELARCMAGALAPDEGAVRVNGTTCRAPRDAIRAGAVFVPEDRKREALFLDRTLVENVEIGPVAADRSVLFRPRAARAAAVAMFERLDVRCSSPDVAIRTLSGGNQQKVLLGRWLGVGASVFILDEPTAGIDVGAKLEIYRLLRGLADDGAAVVLFSSDYEEVKLTADRAIVLSRGRVAGELDAGSIDDERLLALEAA